MRAENVAIGRRAARIVVALLLAGACTNEDVGGSNKSGSGATSGVGGGQAAGGAAGVDTAGGRVNTDRAGSAVAPGPGQIPGTPGAVAGDSAAAKARATRP